MSDDDFEVLTLGTIKELKTLRAFAKDMIDLRQRYSNNSPLQFREKIDLIEAFYKTHNEEYPK